MLMQDQVGEGCDMCINHPNDLPLSISHLYNKDRLLPDEVMDNGRVVEHTDVEGQFASGSSYAGGEGLVHVPTKLGVMAFARLQHIVPITRWLC